MSDLDVYRLAAAVHTGKPPEHITEEDKRDVKRRALSRMYGGRDEEVPTGGDCFVAAYRLFSLLGEVGFQVVHLVHGMVRHPTAGFYHVHAWVEVVSEVGPMVMDFSNGNVAYLDRDCYYALGQIKKVQRYSPKAVFVNTLHYETYGPWEEFEEDG